MLITQPNYRTVSLFRILSDDQIDIGDFQEYFAPEMPEGDCFQIFFPGQGGCDCDCDFCAVVIDCPQTGGDTDGDSSSSNSSNPSATGVNQPIPYENQILDCLGLPEVNSTDFDYGMWLNNADPDDVRAIATFLNSPSDPNNLLAGSNCDDPIAQEFAIAAMEALDNNGEVDFVDEVIFNLGEKPCHLDVIYDAYGLCSPLTGLFQEIFDDTDDNINENYNLTYGIIPNSNNNGGTLPLSVIDRSCSSQANGITCTININFRESYLNTATDLSIARTTIHETLHAVLVYMYESGLFETNGVTDPDYVDLTEAYADYLISNNPTLINTTQHELIADFVDDIATSLSIYGNNHGYNQSFSFYKKLAWGGLTTTETFQSLYPQYLNGVLNPDFVDIINTLAAEQNNVTYEYNGIQTSPQGSTPNSDAPCN